MSISRKELLKTNDKERRTSITMNRLTLSDNLQTILEKMSDGNPGCLSFFIEVLKEDENVFWKILIKLDTSELYGSLIYMLWNDCCNRDTQKTIRMIRKLDILTLRSYVVDKGRGTKYIEEEEK